MNFTPKEDFMPKNDIDFPQPPTPCMWAERIEMATDSFSNGITYTAFFENLNFSMLFSKGTSIGENINHLLQCAADHYGKTIKCKDSFKSNENLLNFKPELVMGTNEAVWEIFEKDKKYNNSFSSLVPGVMKAALPGLYKTVFCPVKDCLMQHDEYCLSEIIIHLNDEHKRSREDIADWLETLDIDLSFKVE